jgi:hypothetical protein
MLSHRIRKVIIFTGIITTVAGSSASGSYSGDNGQATSAGLNQPMDVTVDSAGNTYTNLVITLVRLTSFLLTR